MNIVVIQNMSVMRLRRFHYLFLKIHSHGIERRKKIISIFFIDYYLKVVFSTSPSASSVHLINYPPTGCYDHILDRVLSLLDWTSLHCLLSAGRGLAWAEAVAQHWSSPRLGAQLLARWRSFVPAQREVRWAGTVTCMAATLAAVFAGFSSGRVVRLCRHTGGEQYSVAAHAGPVAGLAVDAAGGWLVTAGAGAVRVWRLAGGRLVCQLARAGRVAELRAERGRWGHQNPRPH